MTLSKTHRYLIALATVTVFYIFNRNIWLNCVVSMFSVSLICGEKIQVKSIFTSAAVFFGIGALDFILQYLLLMYTPYNTALIVAEDIFCFLVFFIILVLKQRGSVQLNGLMLTVFFVVAIAVRLIFYLRQPSVFIGIQGSFSDYIKLLPHGLMPFLKNISYFIAAAGLIIHTPKDK